MSFCGLPATRPPSSVLCRSDGPKREYEGRAPRVRSEEHTSELQSQSNLVCRLLLEKKNKQSDYLLLPDRAETALSQAALPPGRAPAHNCADRGARDGRRASEAALIVAISCAVRLLG